MNNFIFNKYEKVYKREEQKYIVQPKYICKDFDSDCLIIQDHISCWVYDKTKGFCPYLQGKDKIIFKGEKHGTERTAV